MQEGDSSCDMRAHGSHIPLTASRASPTHTSKAASQPPHCVCTATASHDAPAPQSRPEFDPCPAGCSEISRTLCSQLFRQLGVRFGVG